jgi:SpoVK/Ycf46/Vps4 family AAA+-type ATPase
VDAFNAVRPRSVLLLEDIDTCAATRSETDGDVKGVTVGGLLQALDGFATPHGLITIMTTNHPDTLDERLVRAGRVDTSIEIDCVDTDQVVRLCQRFIGYVPDDLPELTPENMVSPAEVMGVFKMHLMDKENAGPALVKLLHKKLSDQKRTTTANV